MDGVYAEIVRNNFSELITAYCQLPTFFYNCQLSFIQELILPTAQLTNDLALALAAFNPSALPVSG